MPSSVYEQDGYYFVDFQPATLNEYNVALAFERLEIPYVFQYSPFGYGLRGSYKVDFVITDPLLQPVEVFGQHWHTGQLGADDKLRLDMLAKHFHRKVIIFWEDETETAEDAYNVVKNRIRVAF